MEPHRGTTILVLGALSLVMAQVILGPIAWVMGSNDLKKMRAGRMDRAGESNTNTGRILGMIGTGVGVLTLCCVLGVFVFGFGAAFITSRDTDKQPTAPIDRPFPPVEPDREP
jgi:hypothetical protein